MESKELTETRASLMRIQEYKTDSLPRVERFGADLNFAEAVEPADRIIGLFRQIPAQYLSDLPPPHLHNIRSHADAFYNLLAQIEKFDPKTGDAYGNRNGLIASLKNQYNGIFDGLAVPIAYCASRLKDYNALESQARAAVQAAEDQARTAMTRLVDQEKEAQRILDEVRRVAAEHGVSQQATYFGEETKAHAKHADTWKDTTIKLAIGLAIYALVSLFIHKLPFLAPSTPYDAVQLGLSKLLIFAVLAYMLILSAKNFLSHTHNAIVNKHRYNALLTFRALSDATTSPAQRDVVVSYAAACIFAPQHTGYVKGGNQPEVPANIIQALPKVIPSTGAVG